MNKQEQKKAEIQELNLLIDRGVSFEVERTIYKKRPGILGRIRKMVPENVKETFIIHEPTLSVLDRIASEQIEIEIDENTILKDGYMNEVRKLTHEHSIRLARILAIAVAGEDAFIGQQQGSFCRYTYDDKHIAELTEIFIHGIKPSAMIQLASLVNTISNMGDFINSIRLMSASRTTMPIRIEENKEA